MNDYVIHRMSTKSSDKEKVEYFCQTLSKCTEFLTNDREMFTTHIHKRKVIKTASK